jgi:hypothetical protein
MRVLRDAAQAYKVDLDAISVNAREELAKKENAKNANKAPQKPQTSPQSKNRKHRTAA